MPVMQFLVDHRTVPLTEFFLGVTSLGTFNIYILLVTLIYVAWNKQLAIRVSVLLLLTSSLNGLLKLMIRNPRPFVSDGSYLKKWAVSADTARGLAMEYSTPSGHAMSASAFYSYLYAVMGNRYAKVMAVAAIFLIGFSRPYLGVHYVEDVLLGWALGLGCALVSIRYADAIGTRWGRFSHGEQIGIALAGSMLLWLFSLAANGGRAGGESMGFLADGGFLTGIVIARRLELRTVNFNPRSSTAVVKMLRYLLTIGMVTGTLLILDKGFGMVSGRVGTLGFMLAYVRFAAVGFVNFYVAPLAFTRIGWAETVPAPEN